MGVYGKRRGILIKRTGSEGKRTKCNNAASTETIATLVMSYALVMLVIDADRILR